MLGIILSLWVLVTIISSFVNTKVSICLYLAYMLLVPVVKINLPGFTLGENFVPALILFGFLYKIHFDWRNLDFSIFKPFIFLYGFYFIMMPFQTEVPMGEMLNYYRVSVMSSFILPFVMWNAYLKDGSVEKALKITLIVCIIIISTYGLFLTTMPGVNPYLMTLLPLFDAEFNEEYAFNEGLDGRVFGRISSVFTHPMTFGLFLCVALVFIWAVRDKIKWKISYVAMGVIILNLLFCGVRSAIGGVFVGVVCYLFLTRRIKYAIGLSVIALGIMYIASHIPGLSDYLNSIADINNERNAVKGSSLEMRFEQLQGCFREIQNCFFEGKGYGWTSYYKSLHGDHPIILAFESLTYVLLCNNGVLGIMAYAIFALMLYRMKWYDKEISILVITLFTTYIAYSCITGEYGYLKTTLIMYVGILICNGYKPNHCCTVKVD